MKAVSSNVTDGLFFSDEENVLLNETVNQPVHFTSSEILNKKNIIFIDTRVPDYESLIANIQSDTEVVILDPTKDGIAQITESLLGKQYDSLHIVSHGSTGSLQLGGSYLNSSNLSLYESQLQQWKAALTEEADILLYGCDVAAGETGIEFVQQLSQMTGADVAASNDLTGSAALGGDWDLEVKTGSIEANLALSQGVLDTYHYVLPASFTGTYSQNFDTLTSSGTWADDSTIQGWYTTIKPYTTGIGSDNTGGLYSFGSTSSPSDRSLGSIASGVTGTIYYGLRLKNDTGSTINSLQVGYTGEQWRTANNTASQKLNFSYQTATSATSLTTGTWTSFTSLNFNSPIASSTAGALDGNLAANRTVIAPTRINLATPLKAGEEIMLRWEDIDDSSFDHGLAIDDLSVQLVTSGSTAPIISLSGSNPSYTENAIPVTIGSGATVTDDFTDFDAGTLTVSITGGSTAGDRLSINNQGNSAGQIGLDGRIINYGGVRIGNFMGGIGSENLVITFETANATSQAVQALLNNLVYSNVAENLNIGSRTIQIVLKDGDGLSSNTISRNINVSGQNDAPIVGNNLLLYDGSTYKLPTDSGSAPNAPWFAYQNTTSFLGGSATQSMTGGATKLETDNTAYAGYTNYGIASIIPPTLSANPLNSAFPILDRNSGYIVSFTAQVNSQTLASTANKNNDGKDDRAGFSVIVLSSDKKGIELGFWTNRIWAQEDGTTQSNPSLEPDTSGNVYRTLFTQAEGFDFNTTSLVNYDLAILGNNYTLFANGNSILSGRLRDYTAFVPPTQLGFQMPDPYERANFIFFGDNTPSAGANINLSRVAVSTNTIPNLTIDEDTFTGPIPFKVRDFETAVDSLNVSFSSSNTALVQNNNIFYSQTGSDRTFTIVPTANQNGTATITMSVYDGTATTQRTFDITVNPINDAPTFSIGGNQSVQMGAAQQTVAGWAYNFNPGINEASQNPENYIVNVIDNASIFEVAPTIDATGKLTYKPTASLPDSGTRSATATIEVRAKDNGGTANGGVDTSAAQTFKITVYSNTVNSVTASSGADNLTATDGNDRIDGLDGDDIIYGGLGNDRIIGGAGNDTLYGDLVSIPAYGATFSMNDIIYGGIGSDIIYGNGGNDTLYGETGNDTIYGGAGDDEIWGGAGDDILKGDADKDTFVLVRGQGKEIIEDFTVGEDILGCAGGLRYAATVLSFTDVAGGALIKDKLTGLDVALVKNVTAASLNNSANFRLM